MIRGKYLLLALSMMLLGACAAKEGSMIATDIESARAECFEQAQDMTNSTIDPLNPVTNDYFKLCMRTRYNYTDEQLVSIWGAQK